MIKIEMNLDFKDLQRAINRLPVRDRVKLMEHLMKDEDTWKTEFRRLRSRVRARAQKHPISPKEITGIVEDVRQKLYDQSHR